jgi:hypothetical protein
VVCALFILSHPVLFRWLRSRGLLSCRDPLPSILVRFAGYMLPHPLIHLVRLKLQTSSSAVSPIEVLSAAIEDLGNETDYLTEKATDAIAKWRKENASGGVMDQF